MLRISKSQMAKPVETDRQRTVEVLHRYIQAQHPEAAAAYPEGYLLIILNDSIRLAHRFDLEDLDSITTFCDLRFRMAAGWYREPSLNAVLRQKGLNGAANFDRLAADDMADAWIHAAMKYDTAEEWRGHLWRGEV
jgi:hypothetical protein